MRSRTAGRGWVYAAMAWTMLYVASKVLYAVDGRLGVTGGPEVDPASYDTYGPGDVAAAQWSNAAVGLLGIAILALPLLPVPRRLPRWVVVAPVVAFAIFALAGGIGMIARALTSDVGGAVFGGYCLIWAALIGVSARYAVRVPAVGIEPTTFLLTPSEVLVAVENVADQHLWPCSALAVDGNRRTYCGRKVVVVDQASPTVDRSLRSALRPRPTRTPAGRLEWRRSQTRLVIMALTPARQRNAVSQGAALGLILCRRNAVPFDKVAVDLSFEGAWRSWPYRKEFSQVDTDLKRGKDGVWALTHADESKQVWCLYWDTSGRELTVRARQPDWDPDDEDDVRYALGMIDGAVPLEGWVALAKDFLQRLEG